MSQTNLDRLLFFLLVANVFGVHVCLCVFAWLQLSDMTVAVNFTGVCVYAALGVWVGY